MKTYITLHTPDAKYKVYDLLTHPLSGDGHLKGSKMCIDRHEELNNLLEFDLTFQELQAVKQLPSVHTASFKLGTYNRHVRLGQIPIVTKGIPRLATFATTFHGASGTVNTVNHTIPQSLYYCQTKKLHYGAEIRTNTKMMNLSGVDCSNVDILIMDSGVDATHPDFRRMWDKTTGASLLNVDPVTKQVQATGPSRVINFDWSLLRDGDPITGPRILPINPAFYPTIDFRKDPDGHGTASASLIAGNRCGIAKMANIYSLRDDHFGDECLRLALAFQRAKKRNLFGLDRTRPTVFANSWGMEVYMTSDLSDLNSLVMSTTLDRGYGTEALTVLAHSDDYIDLMFKTLTNEGVHCVSSSGNNNQYLKNDGATGFNAHIFRKNGNTYCVAVTVANANSYILGDFYGPSNNKKYVYIGTQFMYFKSNGTGIGTDVSQSPLISVGDVTNVGSSDAVTNYYGSDGNAKAADTTLKSIVNDTRIVTGAPLKYNNIHQPFFIKTDYSCFGPSVDIYAPGNGSWAALSNQAPRNTLTAPHYVIPQTTRHAAEGYVFHNGTSAAASIVAGCLSTFVSRSLSTTTPLQAKNNFLSHALSGAIMTTKRNDVKVRNKFSDNFNIQIDITMPFGANVTYLSDNPTSTTTAGNFATFNNATTDDILFCNRFFDSHNLIAQMNVAAIPHFKDPGL